MSNNGQKHANIAWTDNDWAQLMEIVAMRKGAPMGREWDEITAQLNERTGVVRGKRAVQAAFNRLRDALHFVDNKKLWAIILGNRPKFEVDRRGKHPREKKAKKSKVNERVDRLEAQLAEMSGNVNLILENLTKGG